MFAYCNNNPVIYFDPYGDVPVIFPVCFGNNEDTIHVDLTGKLTSYMQANAKELEDYYNSHGFISTALYFYKNVTDGGELDIKLQDEWKFEAGKVYTFNGIELRYDDPGNINFGYVGAVLFSEMVLCFGAGMNQIKKWGFAYGDLSTFFDDPRDNQMIKIGYSLYWEDKQ